MELNFDKSGIFCLDCVMEDIQNCEQTQQIQLPEGMPDVGQILAAWGQPIMRGKEWRGDRISFTGGMMVWVLYAPEDGSEPRCLDAWIPFQTSWDLPEGTQEGSIQIGCTPRFTDARPVSARKILIRAGMGILASVLSPCSGEITVPPEEPQNIQLLKSTYPLRLIKEAGEKSFTQDEELTLPDTAPLPEKLVYYTLRPRISDKKVLSSKVVFRGNSELHVLYRSEEGKLHSVDLEIPFSQYVDLTGEHSTDAQGEFILSLTGVELDISEEGRLRLKCGVAAQFVITDRQPIVLVEDAYCPGRELDLEKRILELPVVLETKKETCSCEQTMNIAGTPVDIRMELDYPRQLRRESGAEIGLHGQCQVLYYGEDGALHAGTARWEDSKTFPMDDGARLRAIPMTGEIHTTPAGGQMQLRGEVELELLSTARQGMETVTGVTAGQQLQPDPGRPSLILRRAGENRLWDLAKMTGSTVEAISRANGLTGEPAPTQMLLIPVL